MSIEILVLGHHTTNEQTPRAGGSARGREDPHTYVLGIPSLLSKFRVPTRSFRRGAKDVVREFEGVARMAA